MVVTKNHGSRNVDSDKNAVHSGIATPAPRKANAQGGAPFYCMLADILEETPIEDDPKDMTLFGPTRPLDTHLGLHDLAPPPPCLAT